MVIQDIDFNIKGVKGFDNESFASHVERMKDKGVWPKSFDAKKAWKAIHKELVKQGLVEKEVKEDSVDSYKKKKKKKNN